MTSDDVSLGELNRRLDRFEDSITSSLKSIDERMLTVTRDLIPREVYFTNHSALGARVTDLEKRMDDDSSFRRSVIVAMTGEGMGIVAAIVLAVVLHGIK
jgi:hypothetical protein